MREDGGKGLPYFTLPYLTSPYFTCYLPTYPTSVTSPPACPLSTKRPSFQPFFSPLTARRGLHPASFPSQRLANSFSLICEFLFLLFFPPLSLFSNPRQPSLVVSRSILPHFRKRIAAAGPAAAAAATSIEKPGSSPTLSTYSILGRRSPPPLLPACLSEHP